MHIIVSGPKHLQNSNTTTFKPHPYLVHSEINSYHSNQNPFHSIANKISDSNLGFGITVYNMDISYEFIQEIVSSRSDP